MKEKDASGNFIFSGFDATMDLNCKRFVFFHVDFKVQLDIIHLEAHFR